MIPTWIVPDWPAPPGVRAASTLRAGGLSPPPWASLNLAGHVGDDLARVAANRELLARALDLPAAPAWLEQVHGRDVLRLDEPGLPAARVADAAVTARSGRVLAVLTADCLPVLFCRADGTGVGIAHAGWRGLAAGVLEATAAAMDAPPQQLLAWIGPGIGAAAYEVGDEVRAACLAAVADAAACFTPSRPGHWQFDLAGLARRRLEALGLAAVHGGQWCTYSDPARFFSHRRDGAERPTGRMATLIWLA
jgi:polyphenol oxidase